MIWRISLFIAAHVAILAMLAVAALARDDGRYATSPLKLWFDSLHDKQGKLCCSVADGLTIADVDYDTEGDHYRVRLDKQWIIVPDEALVTVPNRFGQAVVWPLRNSNGVITIRCFIAGTGG